MALLLCARVGSAARPEPENAPDPRTRAYPHIDWCEDFEGGKPKVLLIVCQHSAWEVYALAMRMEMDFDVFYTQQPWIFAPKTDYYHEGIRLYPEAVKELRGQLQKDWDVVAFVDFVPYSLPAELHYLVLEKVSEGAGVVTFNSSRWQHNWRYPGIKEAKNEVLLQSLPLRALNLPNFEKRDEVVLDMRGILQPGSFKRVRKKHELEPVVVHEVGKGKVIDFRVGGGNYFGGPAIHPALPQTPDELLQCEYYYSLGAKLVLLAAGMRPKVQLTRLDADGKSFEPGEPITVKAEVDAPFEGAARVIVRTPRNFIRHEAQLPVKLQVAGLVELRLPPLGAGRYYVDVWLTRKKKTVDWGSAHFTVRSEDVRIEEFALTSETFTPDRDASARLTVAGGTAETTVTGRVRDAFGRVLVEKAGIPVGDGSVSLSLPLDRTREQYQVFEAELLHKGVSVDRKSTAFPVPRSCEGELFIYTDGQAKNLFGKRRFDLYREFGVTAVELQSGGGTGVLPDLAMASGLHPGYRIWVTHCNAYTGGCISSRTYPQALSRSYQSVARLLNPYGLKFFSIGDDSGVASEFCQCYPTWVRSYIEKQAQRYKGDFNAFLKAHEMPRKWGAYRYMAMQGKLKDIVEIKPIEGDLDLIKECWKENYKSVEEFNRASATSFKSFEEIKEEGLAKLQQVGPCLLGFRDAMKAKHETLETLNAAWGSKLASFEEITNKIIEGLVPEDKFGAKLDKIWYLEDLFIRNMEAAGSGVKSVSKDIGVGMGAATIGNVIPEVLEHINSSMPYKGDRDLEIIRSVPHRYCGHTIGVYGGKAVRASARENQAWEVLFTGGNFIWFWSMCVGGLEGDLSTNPSRSGVMLNNIREMQQGIARALIRAERLHDGIAILHERRAGGLSRFHKELGTVESSQVGFQRIIEDLGMQYRYTWTKEVEAGVLRTGEFRALILPYTQILSAKEVQEITIFVKNGGTLIADFRAATHDWNGRPLEKGALDDLFGIRQRCAKARQVKRILKWTSQTAVQAVPQPTEAAGMRGDASLSVAGAKALGEIGGVMSVLLNEVDKGRAIFLNHAPTTYNVLLNRGKGKHLRALYRSLFALAGAQRRFAVVSKDGSDVSGAEIAVFKNGPVEYLTIEKNSYECEQYPMEALVRLDRKYEVTNTRTAESLGYVDTIRVTLNGLGCYVFTLLPYQVKTFSAEIPRSAKRGEEIEVKMQVSVVEGDPGPHTLRVDVFRPDGQRLWPMYKLETENGRATVTIPVALNEELGKWRLVVMDVTSGRKVDKEVRIRK